MSIGFLLNKKDDAVIWRGPRKNGLIKQFLTDVGWGKMDFLIIDSKHKKGKLIALFIIRFYLKKYSFYLLKKWWIYLIAPPGTSDEHISITQMLKLDPTKDGAIIVTTPQVNK